MRAVQQVQLRHDVIQHLARLKLAEALESELRREILSLLGEGERCVAEIAELLGISKQLARYHLRILEEHRLVVSERRGKRRLFRVTAFPYPFGKRETSSEHARELVH